MRRRPVSNEIKTERRNARIATLKSLIFPAVLCAVIGIGIFIIINYQNKEEEEEIIPIHTFDQTDQDVVMENDSLLFTMDPETTQFTVLDKSSGQLWYSNPEDAENDSLALPEEKNKLRSTLLMSYAVTSGLEVTYNSYEYSVKNGIYEIESGDDFVKVQYSLGKVEKEYVIPPVTTKEQFDAWTEKMDTDGKNLVQQYYKKYNINKLGKKDNKEELLADYPIIAEEVIYVLRDTTKENVRKKMEEIFAGAGYTYEDYLADKEYDNSSKSSDNPVFNVTVLYRLEGDDLVVEIPMNELMYKSEYPMYSITPLPYFGAGGTDETGYVLVPEGGGATINFNNGKTSQNSYYASMYGWDMCVTRDAVVHNTETYFNVYGIARETASFLCVLEDGRSYAAVQADISGKNNSYNYVNAMYRLSQREKYDVGDIANSDIYEYVETLPDENIVQRYRFVDSGDYVDMAKNYGDYLKGVYGDYLTLNQDSDAPVNIEVVGAVDKVKQILGVPVSRPLPLTTYEETENMITDLTDAGLKNMSVKMIGWCNGGVKQKLLKKAKPICSLGSKKDLKQLIETGNELGVDVYLNGITQYAYDSNLLNGFFSYRDAAKLISKERAELYEYSAITFAQRDDLDSYFLLHTDLAQEMADNLLKTAEKYSAGAAFEDNGNDLSADYYRKNTHSRESVMNLQEAQLKAADDSGMKIMINMGNDYAMPYADMITNMDLRGSEYTILDECIPFYQLALHGYINYTGEPLNICGNEQDELLYSAEYGAGLSFSLMDESPFALQKTLYTEYYGSEYASARDRVVAIYSRYNEELGHTFNQEMTGHKNITSELSCTEYADGTRVYVNYGYNNVTQDGVNVPARDYVVIR